MQIKDFTSRQAALILFMILLIFFGSIFLIKKMSYSVVLAREVKYVSNVSQMRKMIDGANALSAFNGVTTPGWVCLGAYDEKKGEYCWGKENLDVLNNLEADKALSAIETIPRGQTSPYKDLYVRGLVFKVNKRNIEIKIFIGDPLRTDIVCSQLNMVKDPSDNLSCMLVSPLIKN
ncbi:MAG: hypothetical protein ACD_56C00110G0013 [uncultured bacterium]|nr:MAG: hypothetical protein ACD_56C00110G0013 [uncultured bacterium]